MQNTVVKVGLLSCVLFLLTSSQVNAIKAEKFVLTDDPFAPEVHLQTKQSTIESALNNTKNEARQDEPKQDVTQKQPRTVTVASGDTLSSIATANNTTWDRIFDKNIEISDPDIITVGQVITIPKADEVLTKRVLPVSQVSTTAIAPINSPSAQRSVAPTQLGGNTHAPGYCTWYAKNRRPDLPNRMGNAISWVSSAQAHGFATGSAPRAGAIGQQGNHVVYVESVNPDGTVTVSEMNYRGLFVVSSRTVPASTFRYIY